MHLETGFDRRETEKMPRSLVLIIVLVVLAGAAMFGLSTLDVEQDLQPVEKPVLSSEAN
ncbi:hypothetical protein [Parasphingorhabdus sp.]|uniref:hypothetical protein n=1 Tax=Parasphingorhabdus sp. TaxID=2709688 RepID=UPI00326788C6